MKIFRDKTDHYLYTEKTLWLGQETFADKCFVDQNLVGSTKKLNFQFK